MNDQNIYLEVELNSQRLSGYFGIVAGIFFAGTIVSSKDIMGILSIYICGGASAYLTTYSLIVLYLTRRKIVLRFLKYFGIFSLLMVITVSKFSFVFGRIGYADVIKETMTFDIYFILIILSAAYNDRRLTIISGFFAAALYGTLLAIGYLAYNMELTTVPEANFAKDQIRIDLEITKCFLLIGAAYLINIIAGNINRLLGKVRESEDEAKKQVEFQDRVIDDISIKSDTLLEMSKSQSRLEKSFSESSQKQLEFANRLSQYISDLFKLAGNVSEQIIKQTDMTLDIKGYVNNLHEWHSSASELSDSFKSLSANINKLVEESAVDIRESINIIQIISEGTASIQEFLTIINDITDRINLLSLNAAIEAARAGEYGKGFAVVADEISKLADATSQQSVAISEHLQKNITDVKSGESHIQKASHSFNAIIDNLRTAQEHFMDVFKVIEKLNTVSIDLDERVKELNNFSLIIASSSKDQSGITGEIKVQIEVLIENANLIIDGSGELTEISNSISILSDDLKKIVIKE